MTSTNASAVREPTPGWVLSRCATGYLSTSCSIFSVNSAIVGLSPSSSSNRSSRRRLAHGARENPSSCFRPLSPHGLFLQRSPSLRATACNWFMMRVRICTMGAGATATAAHLDSPRSAPRSAENDLRPATAEYAERPRDRSSSCVPTSLGFRRRRQSITPPSTPPASAQTSVRAHWLPFPHAASHCRRPDRDKIFPPRDARVAVLGTHLSPCPQKQFAESSGDNHNLFCSWEQNRLYVPLPVMCPSNGSAPRRLVLRQSNAT